MLQKTPIRPIPSYIQISQRLRTSNFDPSHFTIKHRNMATDSRLQALQRYTACDISDALLKLEVPNCGFLPDLTLYSPSALHYTSPKVTIAPASTVLFVPRNASEAELSSFGENNIPTGKHWADCTESGTVVVISQPKGQICAVLGGIMALRMDVLGSKGVVAYGRVRDIEELRETGLPVSVFLL
jgi:regulator of RNase E activity RraA